MNTANYWYRASDDPDQTQRASWQMSAPVKDEQHAREIADGLRAQGYNVQRVTVETTCKPCEGYGRIGQRPRNWRKKEAPPAWMMRYTKCEACNGNGYTNIVDVPIIGTCQEA